MADLLADFGFNGITQSKIYEEDGEIITIESMPGASVDAIIEANKRDMASARKASETDMGVIGARIPIVLHHTWRKEWKAGPRKWGQPWHAFLKRKLNDPNYKKLRFAKI